MLERVDCGGGVQLERGLLCTLSDGVRLASDHYYPPVARFGPGPWPTLLMRQPYGRDIASTVVYAHPAWFAAHGYHVVIQDVRGRGGSEGDFYPFRHEGRDGAESIAWLLDHPACNGRIGMYGFSYQGATQFLAAAENPSGLQCIAPHMAAADLYHGWFYHQGALRLSSTFGWGIQMLREDARRRGLHPASRMLEESWKSVRTQPQHSPYIDHPALADSALPTYLRDWIEHRAPDEYWSGLDISARCEAIRIPAFHIAGWYDTYLTGTILGYQALRQRAATAFARQHQYLLAGPWIHIPWGNQAGDTRWSDAANFDTDALLLRWFDHWLRDSTSFDEEPRVRYFVLGAERWQTADDLPAAPHCALFLHSHGAANSRKGDGALTPLAPANDEPRDLFVYDPEVPVPAPGGVLALSGPADQSALELGNNLLVYATAPLKHTATIFGQPRVILYAQTSACCADLTAKLVRLMPSGRAEFLTIGIARSTFLFPGSEYRADHVYRWEFALEPIAFALNAGDCLLLEVAGSAFPLYDRNPSNQTPPPSADVWTWSRSTHQILHSADHPSALLLPVEGEMRW